MSWIDTRVPPVPEAFRRWLDAEDGEGSVSEMVAAAERELAVVMEHPGRDRDTAFRLLAADAWLTYACEAAAEEADLAAALGEILASVQAAGVR